MAFLGRRLDKTQRIFGVVYIFFTGTAGLSSNTMIITLTCVFVSTLVASTASSDFSLKGDPCSKFDSCFSKPNLRTCSCEDDCQSYGTCCHDFKKQHQDSPKDTYTCYSRRTDPPVFVKRSCAENFKGHIDNKLACFDDDEDEMDVKNNLLVTSHKTKVTYWNKHCAKCSHEMDEDLELWNIEVFCPQHKSVNSYLIRRNLTFDQDKKQWGLEIDGEFLQCIVKYAPPPYIDEVKYCRQNPISTCPDNYTIEKIATICSKYYGERKLKGAEVHYKNVHCAICNGVDIAKLECPGMISLDYNIEDSDFREMVEQIFTGGTWLDLEPAKSFECSEGFTYDPLRTKCRRDPHLNLNKTDLVFSDTLVNSSDICRTNGLIVVAMLFVFMYTLRKR